MSNAMSKKMMSCASQIEDAVARSRCTGKCDRHVTSKCVDGSTVGRMSLQRCARSSTRERSHVCASLRKSENQCSIQPRISRHPSSTTKQLRSNALLLLLQSLSYCHHVCCVYICGLALACLHLISDRRVTASTPCEEKSHASRS